MIILAYSQSPRESFWCVFVCSQPYLLWMKVNVRSDMKGVWLVCASPVFLPVVCLLCLFVSHRIAKGSAAYSWAWACCKIPCKYLILFCFQRGKNNKWNKCNIKKQSQLQHRQEYLKNTCWHLARAMSPLLTFSRSVFAFNWGAQHCTHTHTAHTDS